MNVVWAMQRTRIIPKVHDVHFFGHDRKDYGSLHGRLLSLWKDLRSMSSQSGQSLAEMPIKGPGAQLPLYGPRKCCLRTPSVQERSIGGQGKN